MDKRKKMLAAIDPSQGIGLEIGPLDSPIVTREMGNVRYVDHASTEDLRVKNRENRFVKLDRIVDVDYVWGAKTLPELVASEAPFDYVMASHVIEHVPDLVGWLGEVGAILRPHGVLSLAIPDKRYCFDHYRQPTATAEALEAYLRRQRRPSFRQIFDHLASFATVDGDLTWDAGTTVAPTRQRSLREAWDIARGASADESYHDVHCWVFTPASFLRLMESLIELDLFAFLVDRFFPTAGHEFFVSLKALDVSDEPGRGRAAQFESLRAISEDETRAVAHHRGRPASMARRYLGRLRRILGRARLPSGR